MLRRYDAAMKFTQMLFGSPLYERAWLLRQKVLRAPLGLQLQNTERDAEQQQLHYGLLDDANNLLACVSVLHISENTVKLRQMAVDPGQQKSGLGRTLLEHVENELKAQGYAEIEMHARVSAEDFYRKLGYQTVSEIFTEVTIPHIKMRKLIG